VPSATPTDVLAQRRHVILSGDADDFADLFAPDGVIEAPFAQTQDPGVVIAEMRTKGTVTTTGQSFAATSIQVLRIRDGQIVLFRDFADPRVLEDVMGNHVREAEAARKCQID